jgi:crossover junction endodeoxyribonuclease RuvC
MAYRIASSYTLNTEVFAVLEAVHSMPKQGVASSFSFGRGLGIWEGILSALAVPYVKVAPQTWKKVMMADAPHDNKDASRIIASRLFPQMEGYFTRKKDHNRAEALLMAEYGRRLKRQ